MTPGSAAPPDPVVRGVRRAAIVAVIASLAIAALLGIVALLSGEFGELQSKIMLTTLTVAGFGTTALCHLAIVTRRLRALGFLGIAASAGAAFCALLLVWRDWSSSWDDTEGWLKALVVLAIAAGSLAQANLLLLLAGRRQPLIRVALGITLAAVAVVAVMFALPVLTDGEIPGDDGEPYWRALGVVGILDALGTIALPILGLVLRRPDAPDAADPHAPAAAGAVAEAPEASDARLVLDLDPDLAAALDAEAAAAGISREDAARAALRRALP